ncbi:MAG: adenylyltransferase/cytidyltransferase family protein [Candidatus Pacebacteria bacterium]|nr:adenylyltransferase/cytidyltransferase family protein [Candidatus Paceibacterota bacterium]
MAQLFNLKNIPFKPHAVTLVSGFWDLFHIGHLKAFIKFKEIGNPLVIGILSDTACRRTKGPSRPIISEQDRAMIVSNIIHVDYVFVTPYFYIDKNGYVLRRIKPKVVVFSLGDKQPLVSNKEITFIKSKMPEINIVRVPRQSQTVSTTLLINRIKNL